MGASVCSPEIYAVAWEVGFQIASGGAILICGGGGGVMEAAAKGAKEAGGMTVGILPGTSSTEANPYIDIPVVTGLGNARNVINILTSQVIIAIGGAFGTLSEIALAMKCGTPVVGLSTWDLSAPDRSPLPVVVVSNAADAVAAAMSLID
jgi:uncharacterized protein (TIGR00725 family)